MTKKTLARAGILTFLAAAIAAAGFLTLDLSALPEPGPVERAAATRAKRFLVARASRREAGPARGWSAASAAEGKKLYGVECATCHGVDGRTATDAGKWMYPRAADLASAEVQQYSDAELYWIIKNGIRLSGMPAFGRVESEEHLWQLVHHVRSLGTQR